MHILIICLIAAFALGLSKLALLAVALVLAVATSVPVDLAPLVNGIVVPLLTPIIGAALLWLAYRVQSVFHLHVLDGRRQLLANAINNGIALVTARIGAGPLNVNVPEHVDAVVKYAETTVPGAIAKLGVDPKALGEKVAAEIAKAGGVPAS